LTGNLETPSVSLVKGKMHEVVASPLTIHFPLSFQSVCRQAGCRHKTIMNTKKKGGDEMLTAIERENAIDKFVDREIFACQSGLIEEAFKQQLFSIDEIENLYRPFDGKLIAPAICMNCKDSLGCLDSETGECELCFEANQQPREIFEWWLVSSWLGKKLLMEGQPVIDNGYGIWWGRCATGQAISMDWVIQKVYDDLVG